MASADQPDYSLLLAALDAIGDGVAVIDCSHTFTWVNTWLMERYSDFAPLVGSTCFRLIAAADRPCAGCPLDPPEAGSAETIRVAPCRKSDEVGWVEIREVPLVGSDGSLTGVVAHFHDVTDRMAAEDALREEVSRRRLLVEQSRDGIVVLDENGGVVESNLAFAGMLGYTLEEMLSLHVSDWETSYPPEAIEEMIATVDSAGDHFTTVHRRRDGSTYEVEISTNGAVYGGHKFVFCVCRDISEQRQAQREREALIARLQEAIAELKVLRGIIPVCSFCKKVRDDRGYWEQVEVYIKKHSDAKVSHGICPECLEKHYPGMSDEPAHADETAGRRRQPKQVE